MEKIKVLMSGFGKMGSEMMKLLGILPGIQLLPCVLERDVGEVMSVVSNYTKLIPADEHLRFLMYLQNNGDGADVVVDFSHPSVRLRNAENFVRTGIPFVMGTTGNDANEIRNLIEQSNIPAVLAPNMAKPIVGFQALMEMGAKEFPNLFKEWTLEIIESHQESKADTSGTAKAMVSYFNGMGVKKTDGGEFGEEDIVKIREPEVQVHCPGVPVDYLDGHGYHTYQLTSPNGKVRFRFEHNVNGRDIYGDGVYSAIKFVLNEGTPGTLYSMIDVLKAGY